MGRIAGIAVIALGLACWPSPGAARATTPATRALLTYDVLAALYLAYQYVVGTFVGVWLLPGAGGSCRVGASACPRAVHASRPWARERAWRAVMLYKVT